MKYSIVDALDLGVDSEHPHPHLCYASQFHFPMA